MGAENRRIAHIGQVEVDISEVVRDPRGIEDMVVELLENDWTTARYEQFGAWLNIFADAADMVEWDHILLDTFPPLYTNPVEICRDCDLAPCNLKEGRGKCGLDMESLQGRLSLRKACRGCLSQMIATRELLNYAFKQWGEDKPVSMGTILDINDGAPTIGLLTGIYPKTLKDLNRALCYGEEQLSKLFLAAYWGKGKAVEFESMVMHAGTILMLAQGVAEHAKISCFGFITAADQSLETLVNYPPATSTAGPGSVEEGKPVVGFVGDDFLPAWCSVNYLRENRLTEQVEVCGIGPAGDDVIRFYERGRNVAPMTKAAKQIRTGFADVIVISDGCMPCDLVPEAERVDTRVISVSPQDAMGLADRTDEPIEEIVKELLVDGASGVWIRNVDKAGEVAVKVAQEVKRKGSYVLSDESAIEQAKKCKEDCDTCFSVCPLNLPLSKAVRQLANGNWDEILAVEDNCYLCRKCEEACPAKISLSDLLVTAAGKQESKVKCRMRAGRGPISQAEMLQSAFAIAWGNSPGMVTLVGCGDAVREDVGWMAEELTRRNSIVFVAGCAAADVASRFNEAEQSYLFENYGAACQARNMMNMGGCSATCHGAGLYAVTLHPGGGMSHYGTLTEIGDAIYHRYSMALIVWGALSERMYALAAGYARLGATVIIGPTSGFEWNRYLLGNKYDRSKWWLYHGDDGSRRETEPVPEHLLIPVETKEEALTMLTHTFMKPGAWRDARAGHLDMLFELYRLYYDQLPEDWHLVVRSALEIPVRYKMKGLKILREEYGWETEGIMINKVKNRDGKLISLEKYARTYGIEQGAYHTKIHRLLPKRVKEELKKASSAGQNQKMESEK